MKKIILGHKGTELVFKAVATALGLKHRKVNPSGKFDQAGRFYLQTLCPHCAGIRSPSRAYPYSALVHGRTLKHVYHEFPLASKMTESEFIKLARAAEKLANKDTPNWVADFKVALLHAIQGGAVKGMHVRFRADAALTPEELAAVL